MYRIKQICSFILALLWIIPLGILMGLCLPSAPIIMAFMASHCGNRR